MLKIVGPMKYPETRKKNVQETFHDDCFFFSKCCKKKVHMQHALKISSNAEESQMSKVEFHKGGQVKMTPHVH